MNASEIYDLAVKCYNGDENSRKKWFELLAPLARTAALPYGVLPGIVLARSACESGWGSDLYELTMERKFGVKFDKKAQKHNNLLGMVSYGKNDEYAPNMKIPAWADYKATFNDYGPHGDMGGQYHITMESWKEYKSIEDAYEDFCAVIRSQAYRRGETWPSDLRGQLLSMGRGYTPEGADSKRGMDYSWQDTTLSFYEKYNLYKYDEKKEGEYEMATPVKMTLKNLENHIVRAYQFAHENCHYGRTDTHYPPGQTGFLDCVGLVFRAFWTMGRFPGMMNIDQVQDLCISNGLKKSTDINDVWKKHGIVCFQDKNNVGTQHINHVFYSLGGTSLTNISKYDLGSEQRMRTKQPFQNVRVDEWDDKNFLCMFYIEEKQKPDDVPEWDNGTFFVGTIKKDVGLYTGPGTEYKKIRVLEKGEVVVYGLRITNPQGQDWRYVDVGGEEYGYIYYSSVERQGNFKSYKTTIRENLDDGFASVRVGAGVDCPETFRIPAGTEVTVDGYGTDKNDEEWLHIYITEEKKKKRGYVHSGLVK